MAEQEVGVVTHYFGKISVAGIEITAGKLRVGDAIHILGHTSDFTQVVESMQLENQTIEVATSGQKIGIKVLDHAREHDKVFRVSE